MLLRDLTDEQVEQTIRNPDKIGKGKKNRLVAWKWIKEQNNGIKAVYIERENDLFVITAMPKKSITS